MLRCLFRLVAGERDGSGAVDCADLRAVAHQQLHLVLEAQLAFDDGAGADDDAPRTGAAVIVILPFTFESPPRMSTPFASCAEPFTAVTSPLTCAPSASLSVPFTVSTPAALVSAPSETPPLTLSTFCTVALRSIVIEPLTVSTSAAVAPSSIVTEPLTVETSPAV